MLIYSINLKWRNICFGLSLLALSISIDSLGIGITYGLRNTKFTLLSKCILFITSLLIGLASIFIGRFIGSFISDFASHIISGVMLIIIGIVILIDPIPFDFDRSYAIDSKEAFILGIALSLDTISIGICTSIGGYLNFYFPVLVAIFQIMLLFLGITIGNKIIKSFKVPDKIWNIISGCILILFGLVKLF